MNLGFLYSKLFKKIIRWKSIRNSRIDKTAYIYSGTQFYDSSIGRYSYVGYDSEVVNCEIGAFCSIANWFIVGGAKHPLDWVSTSPVFYDISGGSNKHLGNLKIESVKHTIIGNDVWIGSRVTIMQGLVIGNGAVIGAGAVVTKNVPPYAVVAGVPAKIIRYRFDEDKISVLERSEWWNLPDSDLIELSPYIDRPDLFLTKIKDMFKDKPIDLK